MKPKRQFEGIEAMAAMGDDYGPQFSAGRGIPRRTAEFWFSAEFRLPRNFKSGISSLSLKQLLFHRK